MTFRKTCCTSVEGPLNSEKIFANYDYYEPFNEEKVYHTNIFISNFGEGKKQYIYVLWTVCIRYPIYSFWRYIGNNKKHFVVAEEIFSDEEIERLQEYCSCEICKTGVGGCPCCMGCLKSSNPSEFFIKKARKDYDEN